MTLLSAENISKRFSDQHILKEVSFTIGDNDRIALVGKNGIGKTTLLELLAGKQDPDGGRITRAKRCIIDYVEQEKTEYLDMPLFEFVADARRDLLVMRQRIRDIEEQLVHSPSDEAALIKLGELQHDFEQRGGFDFENEIGIILQGLGFPKQRYTERMRNFSGGEKNRAGLARILAGQGNLLLLDEPTNHLDIESTEWLEDYLQKLNKATLIVSHDRAFLESTATVIWELAFCKIETYACRYAEYVEKRFERRRLQEHHYKHQQEEIKRIEDFVQRNMAGQKTKQAQSKLKYLNRLKRIESVRADAKGPVISMQSSGRSWAHVLRVDDVSLGYGSRLVLSDVTFDLYRGEKVGLVGRNGSGKSSLIKAIIGELGTSQGEIALGNNVDVAYFDQELSDIGEEGTVIDHIWQVDPMAESGRMRSFLGRFGFSGEDAFKQVRSLSGGEKTKLCLAKLLYHPANLVILDEPTNHLDVDAREALEQALSEYDGSCLIVSHDRYFLEQVVDRIIYLDDGRAIIFDGKYSEFKAHQLKISEVAVAQPKEKKSDYFEFKEKSKQKTRHKKMIVSTRSIIADKEKELVEIEEGISHKIPRQDWEQLAQSSEKKKEIEAELLDLYEKLEELEGMTFD